MQSQHNLSLTPHNTAKSPQAHVPSPAAHRTSRIASMRPCPPPPLPPPPPPGLCTLSTAAARPLRGLPTRHLLVSTAPAITDTGSATRLAPVHSAAALTTSQASVSGSGDAVANAVQGGAVATAKAGDKITAKADIGWNVAKVGFVRG